MQQRRSFYQSISQYIKSRIILKTSWRTQQRLKHIILTIISLTVLYWIYVQWLQYTIPSNVSENVLARCEKLCPYVSTFGRDKLWFSSFHSVRHFPDFVCPQNFRNLADWVFGWPNQFFENIKNITVDGKEIAPCLPPGSIIYVRIKSMNEFLSKIYPDLINNFVLITGEGDISSPTNFSYLDRPDSKIIHWFGQNGQIPAGTNPKFTHIPIGKIEIN